MKPMLSTPKIAVSVFWPPGACTCLGGAAHRQDVGWAQQGGESGLGEGGREYLKEERACTQQWGVQTGRDAGQTHTTLFSAGQQRTAK